MNNNTRCESCHEGTETVKRKVTTPITAYGSTLEVETERVVCTGCGSLVYDEAADQQAMEVIRQTLMKNQVLTGEQIRQVREQFASADGVAISRETFASLLGVSPSAIKKAETEERKLNEELHMLYIKLQKKPELIRHVYALRRDELTAEDRKLCEKRLEPYLHRSAGDLAMDAVKEEYRQITVKKQTGYTPLAIDKVREMISILCTNGVSPYRMASLLWLADAMYFARETVGISGLAYVPSGWGMTPFKYRMLLGALEAADVVRIEEDMASMRIIPQPVIVAPGHMALHADEYVVLQEVLRQTNYLQDDQLRELLYSRKWPDSSEPVSYREFKRFMPVF